jgi:hypothetical protein
MRWLAALPLFLATTLAACGGGSLGYGKSGNPPMIKGTDTLVYVVDIVAALHG